MKSNLMIHMRIKHISQVSKMLVLCLTILLIVIALAFLSSSPSSAKNVPALTFLEATPVFRNPVVPGAVISGYFDHNPRSGQVTFYNGRRNLSSTYGFYFSCTTPNMYDFVGR